MDCHMPVMDGFTAAQIIIDELENPPIIIAVTADITDNIIEKCYEHNMKDYLSKPYKKQSLLDKVKSHLKY